MNLEYMVPLDRTWSVLCRPILRIRCPRRVVSWWTYDRYQKGTVMKLVRPGAVVVGLIVLAAACGTGSEAITVTDAWGRTSPNAATNAAFYMSLTGGESSDVLVAADIGECTVVELHETVGNDGVMQMQHLPAGIAFDADQTVLLEPGGKLAMDCIAGRIPK